MSPLETPYPVDDDTRRSIATRISWSAVLSGVVIALSMQFLLALLGTAAGLSMSDKVGAKAIQTGAVIYLALTIFASVFVGGLVTSLLTAGENQQEAILSGFVMWGVALVALLLFGIAGVQGGANALTAGASAKVAVAPNWEDSARQAGVTDTELADLKAKNASLVQKVQDPATQQAALDAATRATWYGFFITWISMLFAAGGAYLGAGPKFRTIFIGVSTRNLRGERQRELILTS